MDAVNKQKRTVVRSQTTKLIKKIESAFLENNVGEDKLDEFLAELLFKEEELKSLDVDIQQNLKLDEVEPEILKCDEYNTSIIIWKTRINKQKQKLNNSLNTFPPTNVEVKEIVRKVESVHINLPRLIIEKFNNDPSDWQRFFDQFEAAIHNNDEISDVDKFNYLKSYLTGVAADAIRGFSLTNANYQAAINTLKERFGRKTILVNSHLNKLLNLNPVKRSTDILALRKLLDSCETEIRNLKSLGVESQNFSALLCPILIKLLPQDIVLEIAKTCDLDENWDVNKVLDILKKEITFREKAQFLMKENKERESKPEFVNSYNNSKNEKPFFMKTNQKPPTASNLFNDTGKRLTNCIFCNDDKHNLPNCKKFDSTSLKEKRDYLMKHGCCFACLKRGHMTKTCKSYIKCTECNRKHLKIMCPEINFDNRSRDNLTNENTGVSNDKTLANNTYKQDVCMQTLTVRLKNNNKEILCRAVIDTGSMRSYVTENIVNKIGYQAIGEEKLTHSLFGGVEETKTHKCYQIHVSNISGEYSCNFQAFGQKKICSEIPKIRNGPWIGEARQYGINFCDLENSNRYNKNLSNNVDILIGADIYGKLMTGNFKLLSSGLAAIETYLGWALMGKIPKTTGKNDRNMLVISLLSKIENLKDLWELDLLGIRDPVENKRKDELQKETLDLFNSTVNRDNDGRYIVSLPWINDHPPIANNRQLSEKRLKSTVKHLKTTGNLESYQNVLLDWVDQGIIEECPDKYDYSGYYLPHRAVLRPNSTTPLRPVFDASSKEKHAFSLNDCLAIGPNLIELIPSILHKFRKGKIGITADIKKAFCQISLKENDRNFVKFLWYVDGDPDKFQVFRHCRVVFGINCSPFLLAATLNHLFENVDEPFRKIAEKLKTSFYVDNLVASLDSEEEMNEFITTSRHILASAQFDLRGWQFTQLDEDGLKNEVNEETENHEEADVSILGLSWDCKDDTLRLRELKEEKFNEKKITKRLILSTVNKIFDPIGFSAPATLKPKLLLQECWKNKINWDTNLPEEMTKSFLKWANQVNILSEIRIPRRLTKSELKDGEKTLHVFCDSSKHAYATCIYLRVKLNDSISGQLVQAKSRVAPLREVSISRLELLSCLIGARLANAVIKDLNISDLKIYYWSDSMNALHWIKNSGNWATFVQNRVLEIRQLSNTNDWFHVPGTLNPADLPSRGCSPDVLKKSQWWNLPDWLYQPPEFWPKCEIFPDIDIITSEKRKTVITNLDVAIQEFSLYENSSSYKKMLRVTAWIFRFAENSKKQKTDRTLTNLTIEELNKAEIVVLKYVQKIGFPEAAKKNLPLKTFIDGRGIIRVRTRISLRNDLEDFRHPIILPATHNITYRIIAEKHLELHHAGTQIMISSLREKFWIIRCRKTVRKVLQNCVHCKRFSIKPAEVLSGPLPEDRVRDAGIFEVSGVDLFGPLFLKDGRKCWVVLFTCAIFRAIHLELITSLSADAFIQALRRFIARRGRPQVIYSDNGTNFVGTSKELNSIDWKNQIEEYASTKRIIWKFNPPAAPWWGGFWERLIRIVKSILKTVLRKSHLDYEELYTVICDTESTVNSRPLTYLSEDPEDLTPLTPEMFLKDIREEGVPDLDFIENHKLKKRFVYRQKLKEDLRKRFRKEYLGSLREFTLVKKPNQIKEGDLVLVRDNNVKRVQWPMAKVIKLYPGRDGLNRVAKLKTQTGELSRAIQSLCPLELNVEEVPKLQQSYTRRGRAIKPPQKLCV